MTMISRDPFGRTELHRTTVRAPGRTCDWCGRPHFVGKVEALFRYSTESDGGRRSEHKGLFCSKSCHDDYYDI